MKIQNILKGFSCLNVILFLIGFAMLGAAINGHLFQLLKPSHDYDYVLENGLKEGDHIKGDIDYSFGKFASQETYTQYETYRTASKTSGYYYIIPVGDYGLAAIFIRKNDMVTMAQLTKETEVFFNGGADTETVLHFNGVAMKMDKSLKGLEKIFKDQLAAWEYTDEEIDRLLADTDGKFLVLDGPADVTTVYIMGGIGAFLIGLAALVYVRRYKMKKLSETQLEEEETKQEVLQD